MIEKLILMLFGKYLESLFDSLIRNPGKYSHISRMSAYKVLMREQADNMMANVIRRGNIKDVLWLKFSLPGTLSESQERYLMEYVQHYLAVEFDPFEFENLRISWSSQSPKVNRSKPNYSKSLPVKKWGCVINDYKKRNKLSDS